MIEKPILEVGNDFDGYFENLVKYWCDTKTTPFKNKVIVITAGPYRPDAVSLEKVGDGKLHIDFYSALRTGFGELSHTDVEMIQEHWL